MEAFVNEVIMAYGNWRFLMLTVILLVVGLAFLKGYKKRFVVPMLIMTAVILNPLFYTLWYKLNDRSYWRMMWMVPIIPVCIVVPAFFIEKSKKNIVKVVALVFASALMILSGSFIYDGSRNVFAAANNPEKLPDDVVAVGEALLQIEDYPTVVADPWLATYLRQYSGKIRTAYARSVSYGWPSAIGKELYGYLIERDFPELLQKMLNYDYKYMVTQDVSEAIVDTGFTLVKRINEYGLYRAEGFKTETREYNELHQLISITYIDENGNPVNNGGGYSKITYGYDDNGRMNYEFLTDCEGKGVRNSGGYAGYRQEYDRKNNVVKQIYLDVDGEPLSEGAAIKVREYVGEKQTRDSYFDKNGDPVSIGKSGYSSCVNEYDEKDRLSLQYYFDLGGEYVECGSSYLHEYLCEIIEKIHTIDDVIVFISIRDEGTNALTNVLQQDFYDLGIQTELIGKHGNSYYAVISEEGVVEEVSTGLLEHSGCIGNVNYEIVSGGNTAGSISSIVINHTEYSKNARGLNIVVVENGQIDETIAFDTYSREISVTR